MKSPSNIGPRVSVRSLSLLGISGLWPRGFPSLSIQTGSVVLLPMVLGAWAILYPAQRLCGAEYAAPRKGVVATVNPVATEAGLQALRDGGNAVDAAIACALPLGVVDGHNSGIGGGCFMTLRLADGRLIT